MYYYKLMCSRIFVIFLDGWITNLQEKKIRFCLSCLGELYFCFINQGYFEGMFHFFTVFFQLYNPRFAVCALAGLCWCCSQSSPKDSPVSRVKSSCSVHGRGSNSDCLPLSLEMGSAWMCHNKHLVLRAHKCPPLCSWQLLWVEVVLQG